MLNGYIGGNYIDGAHWYLTYLILFNVMVALMVFVEKRYKIDRTNLLIFWLIANFITKIMSFYIEPFSVLNNLLGGPYTMFIIMGIALKELLRDKGQVLHRNQYMVLLLFSQIMNLFMQNIITFIAIQIFIFIFIYAVKEKIKILDNKLINGIGDISYITYLLHQNIGYQLLLEMISMFNQYMLIYTFVVTSIILCMSAFIYKYYEIPIQKRISERIKQGLSEQKNL